MLARLVISPVLVLAAAGAVLAALACNTPPKEAHDGSTSAPPPSAPAASASASAPSASSPASPASASASAPASASAHAPSSAGAASASASASKPAPVTASKCSSDADCRTWSSYCAEAPCACRVLASSEPDPKCLGGGTKVRCFADPCMRKVAGCQSGACVLTAK